jgi:hypothetical protein
MDIKVRIKKYSSFCLNIIEIYFFVKMYTRRRFYLLLIYIDDNLKYVYYWWQLPNGLCLKR